MNKVVLLFCINMGIFEFTGTFMLRVGGDIFFTVWQNWINNMVFKE